MRDLLIGAQVAASVVLLILGAVLLRNIQRLDGVAAGFDTDRAFDLRLDLPDRATLTAVSRQPGVTCAVKHRASS